MNYVPLKIKTNYSLLTSLIKINNLIDFAKENNIKVLGICDDNLCAVMEFYKLCKKNDIKPIIGLDLVIDNINILLYAKSEKGYKNLCYITSNEKNFDLLKENNEDLICLVSSKNIEKIDKIEEIYDDVFVFYENEEERETIKNKRCVYLKDIRCLKKEETEFIKYLYMIKNNEKISDASKYDFSDNYFNLNKEINKLDIINYKYIVDSCNLEIKKNDNLLPIYNNEKNFDAKLYLKKLCEKGLLKRLNNKVTKEYIDRLNYELSVIYKMDFVNYFLVVWDYVKFAKKNNILVGPGRGSAAGSLVSYSLGITDIDPIKYNLIFERFLNPERVTMPDIDIDFDSNRREEVIDYVKEKYGKEKVANIIAFGSLKSKQVLRDLFRIFDYENDNFIKLFSSTLSLEENRKENNKIDVIIKNDTLLSRIYEIALHLEGLNRHQTVHAAGIVISSKEISRYIPVYNQNDVKVTGFTLDYLEDLGILKMDFLSIANLDLLSNLKEETKIDLNSIPLDDFKTLEIFNNADTDGIFQFESTGIKNVLKKFNIKKFEDLVSILALYRPGPMENIDSFINRKEGKEKKVYIHKDLEPILKDTYGIIVYQEQIMKIATSFAGFSLGEADLLRRAMSKKKKEVLESLENKFINGTVNNGYSKEVAKKIYSFIFKFANYGFNKSHSVCYALTSYRLAYLKAHYRTNFMCYLLTMNDGNSYKIKDYVMECKKNNVIVLKPDINKSYNYFTTYDNKIYYSLSSIKNIGTLIANQIIKEREKGLFIDFFDFARRCNKFINKKVLESLIKAGCFDSFNINHKSLINSIDKALNYAELTSSIDASFIEKPEIEIEEEYTKEELTRHELSLFGFYLSNHIIQYKRKNNLTTNDIKKYFNKLITLYLIIDRKKEVTTKKGAKMAFLGASDEFNKIELIMFSKIYEENYKIKKDDIVLVTGKVEKRLNEYQIIVNRIAIIK